MAEENEGKEAEKMRTRRTLFYGGCFSGASILDTGSAILPFQDGFWLFRGMGKMIGDVWNFIN
jgi:hypothetical protein